MEIFDIRRDGTWTVADLKAFIKDLPDDLPIALVDNDYGHYIDIMATVNKGVKDWHTGKVVPVALVLQ